MQRFKNTMFLCILCNIYLNNNAFSINIACFTFTGFTSSAGFNFDNLEALESVRSMNDEEFRRLTIARKSLYVAFDPIVNKANQESNSR